MFSGDVPWISIERNGTDCPWEDFEQKACHQPKVLQRVEELVEAQGGACWDLSHGHKTAESSWVVVPDPYCLSLSLYYTQSANTMNTFATLQ